MLGRRVHEEPIVCLDELGKLFEDVLEDFGIEDLGGAMECREIALAVLVELGESFIGNRFQLFQWHYIVEGHFREAGHDDFRQGVATRDVP